MDGCLGIADAHPVGASGFERRGRMLCEFLDDAPVGLLTEPRELALDG